jgi:GNAT superfamily N-acetyltransferase
VEEGGLKGTAHAGIHDHSDRFSSPHRCKRFRNLGVGSRLLADAEQEARRRGCHAVHLMTGSFNALPFYQKRGYTIFGELSDMPMGNTQYFMQKKLN